MATPEQLSQNDELISDLVACQLVLKQIIDVIDIIAPAAVRDKMSDQLKSIDLARHPAAKDPITRMAIEKAIALIDLKFEQAITH
jgi:hypothetical protein